MLIVKVYVNDKQIDELKIRRLDDLKKEDQICEYEIIEPKLKHQKPFIMHNYANKYKVLLQRVLTKLIDEDRLEAGLPIYNGGGK